MKILVAIPTKPTLCPLLRSKSIELSARLPDANPDHELTIVHDYRKIEGLPTNYTPWSRVTRARQLFIDSVTLDKFDYVLWIDADVMSYPADMPSQLILANPSGIAAPMVFIEDREARFYDYAGFWIAGSENIEPANRKQIAGRNLSHDAPYWPQEPAGRIVPMACVGTIVSVPASLFYGHRFFDHPAGTDWFTLCEKARKLMGPSGVVVDRDCVALHANLGSGRYAGEKWHGE